MNRVLVQLGRFGDILNILPAVYEAHRNGRRVKMVVAEEFAHLLAGVSYCEPVVFNGDYSDLDDAVRFASRLEGPTVVSQIYGRQLDHRRITESYMRDSWEKAGVGDRWEQLPLLIDRRDPAREKALVDAVDWSKPVVLVNFEGRSSPFANSERVLARVREQMPEASFVNIPRAHYFFDLLGLFDRAHALLTVDTGTLHLAQASAIPTVALVNPRPWYGSLRRANHLLHRTYREADPEEIVEALRRTMRPLQKLVHLYPEWDMSPEDRQRNLTAAASWRSEYGSRWKTIPVPYQGLLPRNSGTELGDSHPVPFVRDVLELGLKQTKRADDVLVISNSDVGFAPGLTERIRRLVLAKGSAYCYRFDHPKVSSSMTYHETVSGGLCGGLDLFAFTRRWVDQNFSKLPDMVFGRTMWDLVYRDLVKRTGGGELYGGCWHQDHQSFWKQAPENPGNTHNIRIADLWKESHDTTRPFRHEYVP